VRPRCHQSMYLRIKLISESAPFILSRRAARSRLLSFGRASHRRRAHELARSVVCIVFACLFLFYLEKLVHGRSTPYSDIAEPDLMSKHC